MENQLIKSVEKGSRRAENQYTVNLLNDIQVVSKVSLQLFCVKEKVLFFA